MDFESGRVCVSVSVEKVAVVVAYNIEECSRVYVRESKYNKKTVGLPIFMKSSIVTVKSWKS
jgi:hypothetical protein